MRDILFRGQLKGSIDFIEGSLLVYGNGECTIASPTSTESFNQYEVIPETVEQFTGLTDKNGKKIFEGDIVKFNHPAYTVHIGKVVYDEYDLGFYLTAYGTDNWFGWAGEFYEIIGNIHDNPELLENLL